MMSELRLRRLFTWLCVAFLGAIQPAWGVVNGVPVPAADKRFDGVGMFMRAVPGWSCGGWASGTCVLVAPNVVLIARHCLDISTLDPLPPQSLRQYRVRFRRTAAGISENTLIVNGQQCHDTYQEFDVVQLVDAPNHGCDQVLAYLSGTPIGIIPIATAINNPPLYATNIILAGWGYTGECFGEGGHWALTHARGRMPDNATGNDTLAFSWCALGTVAPCLNCPTIGGPFVTANLHDSGSPLLIEVPSTDPADPTPELRVIGTVTSATFGHRVSAWNNSGGQPRLVESTTVVHIQPGDFNGNGVKQVDDLLTYLNVFFAGGADANTDAGATTDGSDLVLFVGQWIR